MIRLGRLSSLLVALPLALHAQKYRIEYTVAMPDPASAHWKCTVTGDVKIPFWSGAGDSVKLIVGAI